MKYELRITEQARHDIGTIYEYIAFTILEPAIAQKQILRIEKAVYTLEQMPERFRLYEKEPWKTRNLRVMPVDNFLVFYIVDNTKSMVTVIRTMYGRRNVEKELDSMAQEIIDNE